MRKMLLAALMLLTLPLAAKDKAKKTSGNPILPEFHADPEVLFSNQTGKFYIYSTTDGAAGWGGYYFTVFSSPDLVNWTHEGIMLNLNTDVAWASGNAWAPCIEEVKQKDGTYKYYFYFSGQVHRSGRGRHAYGSLQGPGSPHRL